MMRLPKQMLALLIIGISQSSFAQTPPVHTDSIYEESKDATLPATDTHLEDIDLLELDVPTVITAARREQKITAVPYAISTINAEDIRLSGARNIADALRLAPGVDVAELSSSQTAVSPRGNHGLLASQVLVLVDGRQIFDSLFGGTLWGSWPFQLEDIERIEIIRGPGGVTWGANTVNGVINIITKDPADQLGFALISGGASNGQHKMHLGYGLNDGKLRMRLSGEYEADDGFPKGGMFGTCDDEFKIGKAALHAIYSTHSDDTFTISAGNAIMDGGFPPQPLEAPFNPTNSGSRASFIMGKWDHRIADGNSWNITAYVNEFHAKAGVRLFDYAYQQAAILFTHSFEPADNHILTWGIDTRFDHVDASNADPQLLSRDHIHTILSGIYINEEWNIAPRWTLSLGGRIDYESYEGFQPSAHAAILHQIDNRSSFYGSVSSAFTLTPPGARFLHAPYLGGVAWYTSDNDGPPHTATAYEAGYRVSPIDRLSMNFNIFWVEDRNHKGVPIYLGPPGIVQLRFEGSGSSSKYGFEWESRYDVDDKLTLLAHYTFQMSDWRSPVPYYQTEEISHPEHKFMVGARYSPTEDLHLSSHLYFVDEVIAPNTIVPRNVDEYFRLDLQAIYEFANDNASISVGVRNLLDPHHYEGGTSFIDSTEVPRTVFAELRLHIP